MSAKVMGLNINLKLIDQLSEPVNRIKKAIGGTDDVLKKLKTELADIKAHQKNITALKNTRLYLEKNSQQIQVLNQRLEKKGKLTEKQAQKLDQLREKGKIYQQNLQKQTDALKKVGLSTKNLTATEAKLNASRDIAIGKIGKINNKLKRTVELRKKIDRFSKKMAIGGAASLAGGLAFGRIVGRFLEPSLDFGAAMSKVQALTRLDKQSEELDKLREQAKNLGATTVFTATQVADAQSKLAMAGFSAEKILKTLEPVLSLSMASGHDLKETSDIASDIQSAFGIAAGDMALVADVLSTTLVSSNVDLEMLKETMKDVAPIAKQAGASIQEVSAMAGLLGNIGIKGSKAGTALRSLYLRMASPPKPAADALQKLNIQIADANGNLRPMTDLLAEVYQKTKDMGNVERTAIFTAMAGKMGVSAMTELVAKAGSGEIAKFTEKIRDSANMSSKMSGVMQDNLTGDILKMKSAFDGLSISVSEINDVAMRGFIQRITDIISKITEWTKNNQGLTETISKVIAVATQFSVAGGGTAIAIAGVAKAFIVLKTALKAHPIITAISVIAAGATLIYDNWEGIVNFFRNIWNKVASYFYLKMADIISMVKSVASFIPNSFLPDSMSAENLDKTIAKYKELAAIKPQALQDGQSIKNKIVVDNQTNSTQKSSVDIKVKIDSEAPAKVEKITSTGIANTQLDVGNLAEAY
jgi:TP901 family phage tail tape measure protein